MRKGLYQHLYLYIVFLFLGAVSCQATPGPLAEHTPTSSAAATPVLAVSTITPTVDVYGLRRMEMVDTTIRARGVENQAVLEVMGKMPRHRFVPPDYLDMAYADRPLPIGYGQTISQPYIVAYMTEKLALKPGDKVLEIGTGSGYQAAVLSELLGEVWTIEIIAPLAQQATQRLESLGYNKIHVRTGDGYYGWPEEAPFDAIIVTAAPDHIPQPLVRQLKEGGRLIIPVGPQGGLQTLWQLVKSGDDVKAYNLGDVTFVPLTGGGQNPDQ